jgi:hypothetical protein
VSLFLSAIFMLLVAFPAAALTPNSTIEEVMAQQKAPGFYLEFRYTIEYIWGWNNPDDRFLGRKNNWALHYLGFEKPASIKSEFFPLEEYDYARCPTRPNRLRIHLKDGTELDYIGRKPGFSVADGVGGLSFDSYTPLPYGSPLRGHTIKCFAVRFVKLHEIKCEDFIGCVSGKISKKFPFDIFSLPSSQITCPKVNFFGSEFDLCFIYEAMRLVKYPIAAALIVKIFLFL